jgi:hypothetical protein
VQGSAGGGGPDGGVTVGWKSLGKGPLIGIGVLGVLVLAAGAFWYQQHRWASACEDDGMRELEKAMQPFRELEEARKSGDAARSARS